MTDTPDARTAMVERLEYALGRIVGADATCERHKAYPWQLHCPECRLFVAQQLYDHGVWLPDAAGDAEMRAYDRAEFDALLKEVVALREWKDAQERAIVAAGAPAGNWWELDAGRCSECGKPFEWVRPGKSQATCQCWSKCPTHGIGAIQYHAEGEFANVSGYFCAQCMGAPAGAPTLLARQAVLKALKDAAMEYGDAYTEGLLSALEIVESLPLTVWRATPTAEQLGQLSLLVPAVPPRPVAQAAEPTGNMCQCTRWPLVALAPCGKCGKLRPCPPAAPEPSEAAIEAADDGLDMGIYPQAWVDENGTKTERTPWQDGFNAAVMEMTEKLPAALRAAYAAQFAPTDRGTATPQERER